MADQSMNVFGVIALLGMMVGGCVSEGTTGSTSTPAASAPTTGIGRVASGSVEDTSNACMARIPNNASVGQRMLAEESCRRDQSVRR
ncbi:MAG: hypothetical protein ABIR36_05265 [Nitrospiraceae bacterium]